MAAEPPVEVVVQAVVDIIDDVAVSKGMRGKFAKITNRPLDCLLKFKNRYKGPSFVHVSTRKESVQPKFDVDNIIAVRSRFLNEGMITIQTNKMTIMIRGGNPEELARLIKSIEDGKGFKGYGNTTTEEGSLKINNSSSSHRMNTGAEIAKRKRARSPVHKDEAAKTRKEFQAIKNYSVRNISKKSSYFEPFPPTITDLSITGISLKRIQDKILTLANLKHLNLSGNLLRNVNSLQNLNSTLVTLDLSDNKIASLDSSLRFPLQNLCSLNLHGNELQMLPDSFVFLNNLVTLDVSANKLKTLPHNIHFMCNLRDLNANSNDLSFLPGTLMYYRRSIDVSKNPKIHSPSTVRNLRYGSTGCPSLLEIAGEAVLNGRSRPFTNLPHGALPKTIMEYLYRAKFSKCCGKLSLRYELCDTEERVANLAAVEVVSGNGNLLLRHAICCQH